MSTSEKRNEAETRAELIDPVLLEQGWGEVENSKVYREYRYTDGQILVGGEKGKAKSKER